MTRLNGFTIILIVMLACFGIAVHLNMVYGISSMRELLTSLEVGVSVVWFETFLVLVLQGICIVTITRIDWD